MKKVNFIKVDEDAETTELVAKAEVDDKFKMTLTWAAENKINEYTEFIKYINEKEMMHIDTGSPTHSVGRYGSQSRVVNRNNPEFWDSLCDYCYTYYGLSIETQN